MYKSVLILVAVLVVLLVSTEAQNNGTSAQFSESSAFPNMEMIESVLKSGFENASLSQSFVPGFSFNSFGDESFSIHATHATNAEAWNLQCVWKAMESAARILTQLQSSQRMSNPAVVAEINRLCRSHASTSCGVNFDEIDCDLNQVYRLLDGTCNNLLNTRWGSAPQPYDRFLPPHYADGVKSFRTSKNGEELPNPRRISVAMKQSHQLGTPAVTLMFVQWGQFLDHDVTHTQEREIRRMTSTEYVNVTRINECCEIGRIQNSINVGTDCMYIDVREDPEYQTTNDECIRFVRSMPTTWGCAFSPLQQINQNTAFVDGSMVYGSTTVQANNVRSYSQGLLRTTTHPVNDEVMPPRNHESFEQRCFSQDSQGRCFLAGDPRIDEVQGLTALHTAFIRLHNIIAIELCQVNPLWCNDDEKLFQETRRIVIALIQQITYRDWLPLVVGPTLMNQLSLGTGVQGYIDTYNQSINPTMRNVFAAAAFRFGHSLISDMIKGDIPANDLPQEGNFFNINTMMNIHQAPSALLKGLTRCPSQPVDAFVERVFTDRLFSSQANFNTGLDLVAINIQRGRDHGIPSYREWRKFCGLSDVNSLDQLNTVMRNDLADAFGTIYDHIDDVDLFPAGLAEPPIPDGGILGPTFSYIIARQFELTKHGDRFWHESNKQPKPFTLDQLSSIRAHGLASILCWVSRHTEFNFQPNPFIVSDIEGNAERNCDSFPFIDLLPWREIL